MRAFAVVLAFSSLANANFQAAPLTIAGPSAGGLAKFKVLNSSTADSRTVAAIAAAPVSASSQIMSKMRTLEKQLAARDQTVKRVRGTLDVNGPLPNDFKDRFSQAVSLATGCATGDVTVISAKPLAALLQLEVGLEIDEITFEGPAKVVQDVEDQASDADSPLAKGILHNFLVEKDTTAGAAMEGAEESASADDVPAEPCDDGRGIDIDTSMPYGELEPFGREDTAQELTEQSVTESDMMVDQLERAEVAEEKRAVFRALTRLRGAAITSFDGIARSQTGNIDEYNKVNKWRRSHPLHHLADEESDISKWAFPDNADFVQVGK